MRLSTALSSRRYEIVSESSRKQRAITSSVHGNFPRMGNILDALMTILVLQLMRLIQFNHTVRVMDPALLTITHGRRLMRVETRISMMVAADITIIVVIISLPWPMVR